MPFDRGEGHCCRWYFDPSLIEKIDFENAQCILDQWHLMDSGLMQIFGKGGYDLLQGHLIQMVKAQSEIEYNETLTSAFHLLHGQKMAVSMWQKGWF